MKERRARTDATKRWESLLTLPVAHDDFTRPAETFRGAPRDTDAVFLLRVAGEPRKRFEGRPRVSVALRDRAGVEFKAVHCGAPAEVAELYVLGEDVLVRGTLKRVSDGEFLAVREVVPTTWLGRIRPRYAKRRGASGVGCDAVAADDWSCAAAALEVQLQGAGNLAPVLADIGCAGWSLVDLLQQVHAPLDAEYGAHALHALDQLAAIGVLARASLPGSNAPTHRRWTLPTLDERVAQLPAPLTQDQATAVAQIRVALDAEVPLRHAILGETGSGKTWCFCAIAAAMIDAGARVGVLLPNSILRVQTLNAFARLFADLTACSVDDDTRDVDLRHESLLVGTTALLHRDVGKLDLVIVDEQQRFGRAQREALVDASNHFLYASATQLPRSEALVRFGLVQASVLRSAPVARAITTRIWESHERAELFAAVETTVREGGQVLLTYPAAAGDEQGDLRGVEAAADVLERRFPGRVRRLSGQHSGEHKEAVLADMLTGEGQILVATSIAETGLDLPNLRRVVAVSADRYGLTSLHQLRGRLARQGGSGSCDLYCDRPIGAVARDRLEVLERTTDGFEIAARDLELRGAGDLAPDAIEQSGHGNCLFFGRRVDVASLDAVKGIWGRVLDRRRSE